MIAGRLPATFLSPHELTVWSTILSTPIYWAGPRPGCFYELRRAFMGHIFLRYLPEGSRLGENGQYLIVATYPVQGAFEVLKRQANGKEIAGPDGSIILVDHAYPKSVYLAFPNVDYEIEIYDPSPEKALELAESGDVSPVDATSAVDWPACVASTRRTAGPTNAPGPTGPVGPTSGAGPTG
jgi:hypothetical protein